MCIRVFVHVYCCCRIGLALDLIGYREHHDTCEFEQDSNLQISDVMQKASESTCTNNRKNVSVFAVV